MSGLSCSVVSDSLWPHRLYSPRNSPGQNTGVGRLSLLQGIFPTKGLNSGLQHCRWILSQLSHKGSPRILAWVAYPFSSVSSGPRDWTRVSCTAGSFFTNWAIREARGPRIMKLWVPRMKRNFVIMKSSKGSRYLRDAYWRIRSTAEGIRMI